MELMMKTKPKRYNPETHTPPEIVSTLPTSVVPPEIPPTIVANSNKKSPKSEKSTLSSRKKTTTKEVEVTRSLRSINSFAMLKLYVNTDLPELKNLYREHCENHNRQVMNDTFPNSGFDLFVPEDTIFQPGFSSKLVNLQVKAELCYKNETTAYFMYPRSSLSKTPLLLANHTGIIDSGYRGFLMGAFRSLDDEDYKVEQNTRLLQICHPFLVPIYVVLVDEEHLSTTTRGEGGFGSTGLVGV
jgi:dUTP pyrophosphatase